MSDDWRHQSACKGLDTSLFFVDDGLNQDTPKAICATCRVREDCLEFAMANHEKYGIWGGLSVKERQRLRRRRNRERLIAERGVA